MDVVLGILAGAAGAAALAALFAWADQGLWVNVIAGLAGGAVGGVFVTILGAPSIVAPIEGAGARFESLVTKTDLGIDE